MKRYKWLPIPPELYVTIFDSFGASRWSVYLTRTDSRGPWGGDIAEYKPCDQRTEWHLRGEDLPLLANETRDGIHTYYLAQPVEVTQ